MTVRVAELMMAILMGVFSLYLMNESAELPIGWIPDEGPGGGAWPFWLAVMMLLSCIGVMVNWVRRKGAVATSEAPYIERNILIEVGLVALALIVTVGLFSFIGVYGALPLFLLFYLRFLGDHSWKLSISLAVLVPIVTFFFFEITLKITLPKGFTEPLFYPLYRIFL
ncbi:MAG: tripartite tricarboxylate transporter TctB family protein [Gammaproteobacteria bacterium]|jgi:putative tricarboxylic transport membrane protein|nr:tripartite tricarboxylate transporter TctB family protein [Gammaproteobacteria bacterium]MDX2460478.1 tripartite tricarboxylate transporter TctB family protein [Gammaproteobacteria bacterium]